MTTNDPNETRDRQLYRIADSNVLQNKLGITDAAELAKAETQMVRTRIMEPIPRGDFGQEHIQAVHKHLFQDVYHWAGQLRQTDIHKRNNLYLPNQRIEGALSLIQTDPHKDPPPKKPPMTRSSQWLDGPSEALAKHLCDARLCVQCEHKGKCDRNQL